MFTGLIFFTPPTANSLHSRQGQKTKDLIQQWFDRLEQVMPFEQNTRLWGRIIYFNHDIVRARDIHNIIKPMFDSFRGKLYPDDKMIYYFEGIRLDMAYHGEWFMLNVNLRRQPDLLRTLTETACLIEVGELPIQPSVLVDIAWR
ncbi:MAG: RusA family crossover junction endodeoxyribonuclease [Caldilineaceae bacterium]